MQLPVCIKPGQHSYLAPFGVKVPMSTHGHHDNTSQMTKTTASALSSSPAENQ
jgi:hypothetical protein